MNRITAAAEWKPVTPAAEQQLGRAERAYLERFAEAQASATELPIQVMLYRDGCRHDLVAAELAKHGWTPAERIRPSYDAWVPAQTATAPEQAETAAGQDKPCCLLYLTEGSPQQTRADYERYERLAAALNAWGDNYGATYYADWTTDRAAGLFARGEADTAAAILRDYLMDRYMSGHTRP